jgi:hypothetical protein
LKVEMNARLLWEAKYRFNGQAITRQQKPIRIILRRYAPRRRKRVLLTRWIAATYTLQHFLGRQRRTRSREKRVYLDRPILVWC